MKIKAIISYDGSFFNGYQRQSHGKTIQNEIEKALYEIYNEKIEIQASGRTDKGVHALGQVISFNVGNKDNLKEKLNNLLNPFIKIKKISTVNDGFHPRFNAIKKEYIYKINNGIYNKKLENYYLQDNFKYDIKLMKIASKILLGIHDFSNFTSDKEKDNRITIFKIKIYKLNNIIYFKFVGSAFHKYMIRNLVGALLEVGKYKIDKKNLKEMLDHPNIKKELPTVKPNGLYLNKVWY